MSSKDNKHPLMDRDVVAIHKRLLPIAESLKTTFACSIDGRRIQILDNRTQETLVTLWFPRTGRPMVMRAIDLYKIKLRKGADVFELLPQWIKRGRQYYAEERAVNRSANRSFPMMTSKELADDRKPPAYAETFLDKPCRLLNDLNIIAGHDTEMPAGALVLVIAGGYTSAEEAEDEDDDNYRFTVVPLTRHGAEDKDNVSSGYVTNDDLQVEPGVVTWTLENSFDAMGQGWEIFDCDGSADGRLQLCRLDSPDDAFNGADRVACREAFKSDEDAWSWVWARALLGDTICKKALEFLYARAPKEYVRIRKHCTTKKAQD